MAQEKKEMKIRKMVEEDMPRVIFIESVSHGKENKFAWPFSFESYWDIYHPNVNFVAEQDGEVVGFIAGKIIKNRNIQNIIKKIHSGQLDTKHELFGWIDMLFTHPDHRHQGVAKALMQTFVEECKNRNALVKTVLYKSDDHYKHLLSIMGFTESTPIVYEKC